MGHNVERLHHIATKILLKILFKIDLTTFYANFNVS